jgi:cell division septation protein DedD
MNNRTITIGAVVIVALAAIFYFTSTQKKSI